MPTEIDYDEKGTPMPQAYRCSYEEFVHGIRKLHRSAAAGPFCTLVAAIKEARKIGPLSGLLVAGRILHKQNITSADSEVDRNNLTLLLVDDEFDLRIRTNPQLYLVAKASFVLGRPDPEKVLKDPVDLAIVHLLQIWMHCLKYHRSLLQVVGASDQKAIDIFVRNISGWSANGSAPVGAIANVEITNINQCNF